MTPERWQQIKDISDGRRTVCPALAAPPMNLPDSFLSQPRHRARAD
jgi:hypothetical protein